MSELQTIDNIKIPYPIEGVIRTAQLDDTIAPEDSVQLAVNMNFDRVGAIQTRPGVTSYADSLVEQINNFAGLRNTYLEDGYNSFEQLGSITEIATTFSDPSAVKVSDTKIAVFWRGVDGDGFCRNFEVDQTTGAVTPLGSAVEFDTTNCASNKAILISATQVLNVWQGTDNDGFARVFNVSGDTISPQAAALEFDTSNGSDFSLSQIDSTHVLCTYVDVNDFGIATVFAINLGTGAVTEPGSPFTFEGTFCQGTALAGLGDGTHFIVLWYNAAAQALMLEVDTGTWGVSAAGSIFNYDTLGLSPNVFSVGDGEHFVAIFQGDGGPYVAQAMEVDTGTYAITNVGTPVDLNVVGGNDLFAVSMGDGEHFTAFYSQNVGDGYIQLIEMDPTTYDMSLVGTRLSGYDFANGGYTS